MTDKRFIIYISIFIFVFPYWLSWFQSMFHRRSWMKYFMFHKYKNTLKAIGALGSDDYDSSRSLHCDCGPFEDVEVIWRRNLQFATCERCFWCGNSNDWESNLFKWSIWKWTCASNRLVTEFIYLYGLYYTDCGSVFFVLLAYWALKRRRYLVFLLASIVSLGFRQTNIIWTAVFCVSDVICDKVDGDLRVCGVESVNSSRRSDFQPYWLESSW